MLINFYLPSLTVKSVQSIVPNIQTLLDSLTKDSEKIIDLGQAVKVNIASLKEKIAVARNQANLVYCCIMFVSGWALFLL